MAVNGDDKAAIEVRKTALETAYSNAMQAQQSQQQAAQANTQQQGRAANDDRKAEDIIDADFEDVSNG